MVVVLVGSGGGELRLKYGRIGFEKRRITDAVEQLHRLIQRSVQMLLQEVNEKCKVWSVDMGPDLSGFGIVHSQVGNSGCIVI